MKLDHNRIKEILPDYLKGSLPEEMRSEIENHLKDCKDCRSEMSFITELMKVEVPDPGDLFWQVLPQRIKGTVEEEKAKRFSLTSLFLKPLPVAAAVSVLILLLLTYTDMRKNKEVPTHEPFFSPFTVTVVDYSALTEKDIPLISEKLAVNELSLQTENFLEYSYVKEFASLNSKEMEGLYEALKKESGTGG